MRNGDEPVIVVRPKGSVVILVVFTVAYVILMLLILDTAYPFSLTDYNALGDIAIITFLFGGFIMGVAFMPTVRLYQSGMEVLRLGRVILRADYSDVRSAKEKMKIMGRGRPRELYVDLSFYNKRRPVSLRASWAVSIAEPNLSLTAWLRQKVSSDAYLGFNEQTRR